MHSSKKKKKNTNNIGYSFTYRNLAIIYIFEFYVFVL